MPLISDIGTIYQSYTTVALGGLFNIWTVIPENSGVNKHNFNSNCKHLKMLKILTRLFIISIAMLINYKFHQEYAQEI